MDAITVFQFWVGQLTIAPINFWWNSTTIWVKWWGPKHLGPSNICELSLHPKFQSPTITPSHKKAGDSKERRKKEERKKKKNNDFNGHLVPDWLRQWGLSVSQRLHRWESVERSCQQAGLKCHTRILLLKIWPRFSLKFPGQDSYYNRLELDLTRMN